MKTKFLYQISMAVVFSTLFFTACKKKQGLPLDEGKAVKILADIHIAEAALKPISGAGKDSAAALVYQQIRSIHGVDQATIDTMLAYLKQNPEELARVYEKVMVELDELGKEEKE